MYNIHPTLEKAQPNLSDKDYQELVDSIGEVGQTNPLVLCRIGDDKTDYLFDGHHRKRALETLGIDADISLDVLDFDSVEDAIKAMRHNNEFRRQKATREELEDILHEAYVNGGLNSHGGGRKGLQEPSEPLKTNQQVANENGVSKNTVKRARKDVVKDNKVLESKGIPIPLTRKEAKAKVKELVEPVDFPYLPFNEELVIDANSKWWNPFIDSGITDSVELAQAYFEGYLTYARLNVDELFGVRLVATVPEDQLRLKLLQNQVNLSVNYTKSKNPIKAWEALLKKVKAHYTKTKKDKDLQTFHLRNHKFDPRLTFGSKQDNSNNQYLTDTYATLEDLKKAYRELTKKYHPDVNQGDDTSFLVLSKEYESLKKRLS